MLGWINIKTKIFSKKFLLNNSCLAWYNPKSLRLGRFYIVFNLRIIIEKK